MDKKWTVLHREKIGRKVLDEEILRILLKNRKIYGREIKSFLSPENPDDLKPEDVGLKTATLKKAKRLIDKIGEEKGQIIIFGDYDADGLCGTAIIWEMLWEKGFAVMPYIPNRIEEGYGISIKTVEKIKKKYPDIKLLITVDNGIVAHKAVKLAKKLGIKVIITDHHIPLEEKPLADVIVHSTQISGSAVAWFLAKEFGVCGLDLVTVGTIADMLPLKGVNRSFAKFGLREIGKSKRPGILSLLKKAGIEKKVLSSYDVSFILGPRLNAAGRMDDALDSLRLLCTPVRDKADVLAGKLERINKGRQETMNKCFEQVKKTVDVEKKIIFAAGKNYHQGIIGLVAGKLVEEFYRPVILIWEGEEISKGSSRSVNGFDILKFIRKADDLLIDVGGHFMAAGFTLKSNKLKQFERKILKIAEKELNGKKLIPELKIDVEIGFSLLTKRFFQLLQKLAPFGFGNPEPVFLIKRARVLNLKVLGKDEKHLKIWLDDPQTAITERIVAESIGFGWGGWKDKLFAGDLIDIAFNLDLNCWNGAEKIQLKIKDMKKVSSE